MTPALVLEPSAPLGAARLALETHLCVRVPRTFDATTCAEMVRGVYASREEWTHDFDGEQFCLGRAWYTHLETDRVAE